MFKKMRGVSLVHLKKKVSLLSGPKMGGGGGNDPPKSQSSNGPAFQIITRLFVNAYFLVMSNSPTRRQD